MPLTDKALEAVLAADGWPFERLDATTWHSGFQAPGERQVRFFLRLTDNWLFLTIIPFAVLPDDGAAECALMRRLLELNRRITLAKFAIEHREIVLTVELATQDLTPNQIKDGLDALSLYASRHHFASPGLLALTMSPDRRDDDHRCDDVGAAPVTLGAAGPTVSALW